MNSDETAKRPGLSPRAKQILIGIAGVGALLLGALLIYSVLVTPERQPYRDALSQYKQVYSANVAFMNAATALNGTTGTEEQSKSATEATEKAIESLVASNDSLGKQEVLADGEGKKVYEAFSTKLGEYISYNRTVLESRQQVRPVLTSDDCSVALASTSDYASKVKPMKSCASKMKALEGVKDADYKALVDSYNKEFVKLVAVYEQIAALADPNASDKARQNELVEQHEAILNDITKANAAFASNLQKSKAAVDITASAQELDAYLTDKSSVF